MHALCLQVAKCSSIQRNRRRFAAALAPRTLIERTPPPEQNVLNAESLQLAIVYIRSRPDTLKHPGGGVKDVEDMVRDPGVKHAGGPLHVEVGGLANRCGITHCKEKNDCRGHVLTDSGTLEKLDARIDEVLPAVQLPAE